MSRGILCFALLLSFCTLSPLLRKRKGKPAGSPLRSSTNSNRANSMPGRPTPSPKIRASIRYIVCVSEPAHTDSRFSLASIFKPNDTDYPRDQNLVGMTKKCRIRTAPASVFQLSVFLETDRKAEEFRIILAAEDGQPYVYSMVSPAWRPLVSGPMHARGFFFRREGSATGDPDRCRRRSGPVRAGESPPKLCRLHRRRRRFPGKQIRGSSARPRRRPIWIDFILRF